MKILVITTPTERIEVAIADKDLLPFVNVLEESIAVTKYHVDGMDVEDQQNAFGAGGFRKWLFPKSVNDVVGLGVPG